MKTKTKKKQAKRKMKHEILRTNVAGVQYADVQLAHNLKAGAIAKMYWERDNKYDPLAIRLEVDGIKIGYIPKQSTSLLHDYRNAGHRLTCEVTGYFRTNPTWNQLHVKVLAESLLVKNADVRIKPEPRTFWITKVLRIVHVWDTKEDASKYAAGFASSYSEKGQTGLNPSVEIIPVKETIDFDEPDYDPHLAEEHEDSF